MAQTLPSKAEFEAMLRTKERERDQLVIERDRANQQIAAIVKTIDGLRMLCAPLPPEPATVTSVAQEMIKHAGLTDVVRMALQAEDTYLTVFRIISMLKEAAYPLERLENARAAIVVVLSRLVSGGEVERRERIGGIEPEFRWIASTTRKRFLDGRPPSPKNRLTGLAPLTSPEVERNALGVQKNKI